LLPKLLAASLRGLFDLRDLETWKSSLTALDSFQKMSISAQGEIKEGIFKSLQ
jgi:hypothetical protein